MRRRISFRNSLPLLSLFGFSFFWYAVGYTGEAVMTEDAIEKQFEPLLRRSQNYQAFINEVSNDQVFLNISKNERFLDSCVQYASSKSPAACAFGILSLSLSKEGKKDALKRLFNYLMASEMIHRYDALLIDILKSTSMQESLISNYSMLAAIPDAEHAAIMVTTIPTSTSERLAEQGLLEKYPTPLSAFLVENLFTEAKKSGKKVPNGERLLASLANQSIVGKVVYLAYGELDDNKVLLTNYKLFMEDNKVQLLYKMSVVMHRDSDIRSGKLPIKTLSISAEEMEVLLSLTGK